MKKTRTIRLRPASWLYLISAMCLAALIFYFSSRAGHQSQSQSDLILKLLHLPASYSYYVRKGAHFSIYLLMGILGWLFFDSLGFRAGKALLLTLIFAFLYAGSDELHQHFVPGRSGQFTDVLLDTLGASAGMLLAMLVHKVWYSLRHGFA